METAYVESPEGRWDCRVQIQQRHAWFEGAGGIHRDLPKIVRIISIHDRVYTRGELFPDTTVADVLWLIGAFPEEIAALRKYSAHIEKLRQNIKAPATPQVLSKADREKMIVDMYTNGHSLDDIWAASGFSSKSSIWRILNKHNVKLDRGQTSGPRVKQKPKEDRTAESNFWLILLIFKTIRLFYKLFFVYLHWI